MIGDPPDSQGPYTRLPDATRFVSLDAGGPLGRGGGAVLDRLKEAEIGHGVAFQPSRGEHGLTDVAPREPREPRRDIAAQQQRFDIGTQASHLRSAARAAVAQARAPRQIGRAACRERVCPCVSISVVAGYFKKNKTPTTPLHIDTHSIHIAKP